MGKYMRKAKSTGEVAVIEGVCTRAKTLALQRRRLQYSTTTSPPSNSDSCYLQLRSRRLVKPLTQHSCGRCTEKQNPKGDRLLEIEGSSFGENNLEFEARGRSSRESTPCSLIRSADTISTPGSTTKQSCTNSANQRTKNGTIVNVPNAPEVEEFFNNEELPMEPLFIEKYSADTISTPGSTTKQSCTNYANQRTQNGTIVNVPNAREVEEFFNNEELPMEPLLFIEKYNFDFRSDLPLPGRYDWVRVKP